MKKIKNFTTYVLMSIPLSGCKWQDIDLHALFSISVQQLLIAGLILSVGLICYAIKSYCKPK